MRRTRSSAAPSSCRRARATSRSTPTGRDLDRGIPTAVTPGFSADQRFNVGALSLGYIREVARLRGVTLGLGGMGTLNVVPSTLRDTYGSRAPLGGLVFVRLRPTWQRMGGMGAAPMSGMAHDGHGGHE